MSVFPGPEDARGRSDATGEPARGAAIPRGPVPGDAAAATPPPENGDAEARALRLAFAPLHKRAFGIAVGTAFGVFMFVFTAVHVVYEPADGLRIELLRAYFYGYSASWPGAVVGAAWGFATGFVMGWFIAFCRNLVIAISVFLTRTRAELQQTREFLDHI